MRKLFATIIVLILCLGTVGMVLAAADEFYDLDEYDNATTKAYYRFSNGAATTDSKDSHTLTAISSPQANASGKFGYATTMNGNDAYSMASDSDIFPTGSFSVGAWVNIGNLSCTNQVVSTYNTMSSSGLRQGWYIAVLSSETARFHVGQGTSDNTGTVHGDDVITANQWTSLIGTYDGTDIKLYVDGVADGSVEWINTVSYGATKYPRIGCAGFNGVNSAFFNGSIDDAWIINGKALSPDEVECIALGTSCGGGDPCTPTAGQPFFQSQDCYLTTDVYHNDKWIDNGHKLIYKGGRLILE